MKYYLPAIFIALVILVLSTRATVSLPFSWTDLLAMDKIGHTVAYGTLTAALLWGIWKSKNQLDQKIIIWAFVLCSLYGISLEIVQYSFFPNRYFEVLDILANIIGSLAGVYLFKKWSQR